MVHPEATSAALGSSLHQVPRAEFPAGDLLMEPPLRALIAKSALRDKKRRRTNQERKGTENFPRRSKGGVTRMASPRLLLLL